ncbi:hypothetical protein BC629DRAFT_1531232 [Irpex lacteus]|nr:hypothetical protein BC629DRAFT_1531232 [Irpex lacteus]
MSRSHLDFDPNLTQTRPKGLREVTHWEDVRTISKIRITLRSVARRLASIWWHRLLRRSVQ